MTVTTLSLLGALALTAAPANPYTQQLEGYRKQMAQTVDAYDAQIDAVKKSALSDPEHGAMQCGQMEDQIDGFLVQFNAQGRAGGFRDTDPFPLKSGTVTARGVRQHLLKEKKALQDLALKAGDARARLERTTQLEASFDWQQVSSASLPALAKSNQRYEWGTAKAIVAESARFERWVQEARALKVVTDATTLKTRKGPMKVAAMLAESRRLAAGAAAEVKRIDESSKKRQAEIARNEARWKAHQEKVAAARPAAAAQPVYEAEVASPLQEGAGEPAVEAPEPAGEAPEPAAEAAKPVAAAPEAPQGPACLCSGAVCGDKNHPELVCCPGTTCQGREPIYSDGELGFGSCR